MLRATALTAFAVVVSAALTFAVPQARADRLLIERVSDEPQALPTRGMHMTEVERRFGAPSQRLDPKGGQKRQWPTINRWTYSNFVVYFEKDRVIDAVAIRSGNSETGPKPPVR